jgi:hypothetical protein
MRGHPVIYLECPCGHVGKVPDRKEWDKLLRDQLLPKFRCSKCGAVPANMSRVWALDRDAD